MEYRNLGRTGVKVSPLCLGTMNFGYRTEEADAEEIINSALDAGINFVDTANFYGQPAKGGRGQGLTEEIIGRVFAKNGKRQRVVLATKVYAPTADYPEDPNASGLSRRHIIAECERSLKRLNTDYIDLYQLHRPQASVPIDETLRALDDLVRAGKVRYIGTSEFPAWRIVQSLWASESLHANRFVTEQAKYHLLDRDIEQDVVPVTQEYGIAILSYSPLAGGMLTGKYPRDEKPPEDSRANDATWGDWAQSFKREGMYELLDVLAEIGDEKSCTVSQVALAWNIQQTGITSAIIGPRTLEQFKDNLGALDVTLSEDDLKRIHAVKISPA